MERFVNIKCSEEEFINLVFKQLERKLNFLDGIDDSRKFLSDKSSGNDKPCQRDLTNVCLRCKHVAKPDDSIGDESDQLDEEDISLDCRIGDDDGEDDDISFNLVNLFKKIMLRRSADVRRAVETLLRHPKLLDRSKIPASFYLQALGNQCSILRRTRPREPI
jgi:hypothetical protein